MYFLDRITLQWSCLKTPLHYFFKWLLCRAKEEAACMLFCKIPELLVASVQRLVQTVTPTDADTEHSKAESILRLGEKHDMYTWLWMCEWLWCLLWWELCGNICNTGFFVCLYKYEFMNNSYFTLLCFSIPLESTKHCRPIRSVKAVSQTSYSRIQQNCSAETKYHFSLWEQAISCFCLHFGCLYIKGTTLPAFINCNGVYFSCFMFTSANS